MTATVATRTMRALAKTRPEPGLELVERPVPVPAAGEVLLHMEAASICGTDLHLLRWDPWAREIVKPPTILGHELAGRVVASGPAVSRVREGDLVGVESHIVDWTCTQCRRGDRHLCRNLKVIGAQVDVSRLSFYIVPLLLFHFIFDTFFTFIRRLKNSEPVYLAHRTHLYQLLNRTGFSHAAVSLYYWAITVLQGIGAFVLVALDASRRIYVFVPFLVYQAIFAWWVLRRARARGVALKTKVQAPALRGGPDRNLQRTLLSRN